MVKAGYFLPWEEFDAPELVRPAKLADDQAGQQRADAAALAGRLQLGRVRGGAAVCFALGAPWPAVLLLPLLAVVAAADLAVDHRKPRGEPGLVQTVPLGPLDRVTVVLLTYNCGHRVRPVLDRLAALGTPIIVVDNGSTDDTRQVVAGVPGTELVALPGNLGAAARNAGLERASTPYVAFCDDDGWYDRDGLAAAVDLLDAHPRLGLVNARILVGDEQRLDVISAEMAASPVQDRAGIPGPVLLSFMAGAAIVRRAAYQEVGGYDERFFIGGEEETLAMKLVRRGWQLRYAPGVVLHHRPSLANAGSLRHVGLRNTVVNAWLHRPLRSALRWTVFSLADAPKNRDFVRGLALILRAVPWIVRERAPMPAGLDADLRLLDERRFRVRRRFLTFREDLGRSAYP